MLRRQGAKNSIDPDQWREKDIINNCYDKLGRRTYRMIERILREFVRNINQEDSGGFFCLAMIIGYNGQAPHSDVQKLWDRMTAAYGNDTFGVTAIQKTLGTLLMIIVAEDHRYWVWEPDPEKREKLDRSEKPDGNIYYVDHHAPKKHSLNELTLKFNKSFGKRTLHV